MGLRGETRLRGKKRRGKACAGCGRIAFRGGKAASGAQEQVEGHGHGEVSACSEGVNNGRKVVMLCQGAAPPWGA